LSEHEIQSILIQLESIRVQLNRLVADAESEKDLRKERNRIIDNRLKELEDDKLKRDTTLGNIKWLWLAIGAGVTMVIKYLVTKN